MGRKDNSRYTNAPSPTKRTQAPPEARTRPDFRQELPHIQHDEAVYHGTVICMRCHAIHDSHKRWHLNEEEFQQLSKDDAVEQVLCPGCLQIEDGRYDGQVVLTSPLIPDNEAAILGLIHNTEAQVRANNPLARIAGLTVKGETIEVLTITPFLAERIGKELQKAYQGTLEIKQLDRARFKRVMWYRED
ncbi:MAG: hypothetical protein ACLGIN_02800 [Candidatus Sericytochromatia bacterium]